MKKTEINAPDAPSTKAGFAQAIKVSGISDLLVVSGQVPVDMEGGWSDDIREQSDQIWRNIDAQLREAGFARDNLIKVTTYLSRADDVLAARESRNAYLDGVSVASTLIIAGIMNDGWLLEIEVMAAR